MKLTRIIAPVMALLLLMPAIASAEQQQPLKTSLSGDLKLDLNFDPHITVKFNILGESQSFLSINAHFSGSSDADSLKVSVNGNESTLTLDGSGNFDQTFIFPMDSRTVRPAFGGEILADITFPDIIVKAYKGGNSESVKYGGAKIDVNIPIIQEAENISAIIFSRLERALAQVVTPYQGVNQNLTKEWVARNYSVTGSVYGISGSVTGQLHYKGVTYADKIIISYPGEGALVDNKIDVGSDGTFESIIDINGFCDTGLYGGNIPVIIKAVKGQNEVLSTKVLNPLNRSLYIGDINDDGKINSIDYVLVKKYVSGMIDKFPLETGFFCADVNDDRKINSADASYIKRYILGIIDKFPKQGIIVYNHGQIN